MIFSALEIALLAGVIGAVGHVATTYLDCRWVAKQHCKTRRHMVTGELVGECLGMHCPRCGRECNNQGCQARAR